MPTIAPAIAATIAPIMIAMIKTMLDAPVSPKKATELATCLP